jgi:predicted DNA-binding protein (MmcQ/YjbR family)
VTTRRPATRDVLPRLRSLCLAFPEASETAAWGHPNFRAGKKTFAAYETVKGRPSIAFRLGPREIARLLRRQAYFVTPYGRGKWVSLWADTAIDWEMVSILLRRSYGEVALKRMLTALDRK